MIARTKMLNSAHQLVLIVEDEPMLAFAMELLLTEAGFEIAGVAGRLEKALAIIESGVCSAAILDTNLAGVSAAPAALALAARGLPFLVLSGYLPSQQPPPFAEATLHLQKPCSPERLIQALRDILPVPGVVGGPLGRKRKGPGRPSPQDPLGLQNGAGFSGFRVKHRFSVIFRSVTASAGSFVAYARETS